MPATRGTAASGRTVTCVADAGDHRVYTYSMSAAIHARLASLTLDGIDVGEFDPATTEYEGVITEGVTQTAVTAEAMQRRTAVVVDPPDADRTPRGTKSPCRGSKNTVTVTSQDGTRTNTTACGSSPRR